MAKDKEQPKPAEPAPVAPEPKPAEPAAEVSGSPQTYAVSVEGRAVVQIVACSATEAIELYHVGRAPLEAGQEAHAAVVGS